MILILCPSPVSYVSRACAVTGACCCERSTSERAKHGQSTTQLRDRDALLVLDGESHDESKLHMVFVRLDFVALTRSRAVDGPTVAGVMMLLPVVDSSISEGQFSKPAHPASLTFGPIRSWLST